MLICVSTVIYVGSTDNLQRRLNDHWTQETNPCIQRKGWDHYRYHATSTVQQAKALECQWYAEYDPPCNKVAPPGYR